MAEKAKVEKVEKTFTGIDMVGETILVYLVSVLGFVFSFMDENKYSKRAKFLYNQAGALFIVQLCLSPLCAIPFVGLMFAALQTVIFVFAIIALIKGCQGEDYKIPGIYDLGQAIWGKKNK
ncbi:MAG: hypothetical protein J6O56_02995 [Bacilli bacterium]|nr:hypothetical protein [Bacilli bacterium]